MFDTKNWLPLMVEALRPKNEHRQYDLDELLDIEKLASIVFEALEAESEYRKYVLKIKQQKDLPLNDCIWIPTLDGSPAYDLGRLCERADCTYSMLRDICILLGIDQARLIATVKSIRRKERHNGRWDNPCLTCHMGQNDKKSLYEFVKEKPSDYTKRF